MLGNDTDILGLLLERRTDPAEITLGSEGLYTFINPYSYLIHRDDPALLARFHGVFFDALSMVAALNLAHNARVQRHSFDLGSLAGPVLAEAEARGLGVFFAGTTEERLAAGVGNIRRAYPTLRIVGARHGFFLSANEFQTVAEQVAEAVPDIVVAGMGAPLQERFLFWRFGTQAGGEPASPAGASWSRRRIPSGTTIRW